MSCTYRLSAFGTPLEPVEVELPIPERAAVLVEIDAAGICHSDLNVCSGRVDLGHGKTLDVSKRVSLPVTPGHEIAGRIIAAGPDADANRIGERVAVYPWIGCGDCPACMNGQEPLCPSPRHLGFERPGGFAKNVLVPDGRFCLPIGEMPAPKAALLGCAGLTAWSAVEKCGHLPGGSQVSIIGAGGVGLAALGILRRRYPGITVHVIDRNPSLAETVECLSGQPMIDAADLGQVSRAIGQSICVIDCVGSGSTIRLALENLPKGGQLIALGLFGGALDIPTFPIVSRSLVLRGSFTGTFAEFKDLLAFSRQHPDWTILHEIQPFGALNECLARLQQGRVTGRLVITH